MTNGFIQLITIGGSTIKKEKKVYIDTYYINDKGLQTQYVRKADHA